MASHLALGGTAANMLFGGWQNCMRSVMVPWDRALLRSYRLSLSIVMSATCNGLATICNANFDWGYDPKSPLPMGRPGSLSR